MIESGPMIYISPQNTHIYMSLSKLEFDTEGGVINHRSQNQVIPTRLGVPNTYINIFYFIGTPLKMQK